LIVKGSGEEKSFINNLIKEIKAIDTKNLTDVKLLEKVVNLLANTIEEIWDKNLKIVNITIHLKSWWDLNCSRDLEKYRSTRSLEDWKQFKKIVKSTKHLFFDQKIQEITNRKGGP